jgi:D-lactate dehydrogenase
VLGPAEGDENLAEIVLEVARRAERALWIPDDIGGHCCGMPFASKGFRPAYVRAVNRTVEALSTWTERGRLPVVVDSSPCAYTLSRARADLSEINRRRFDELRLLDGLEYAHDELLPRLSVTRTAGPAVLHPVCSVEKMQLTGKLEALAAVCAESATIPIRAGCCGFAGDRGFRLPELTRAALAGEAEEIGAGRFRGWYSSSRTCEIGLTRATGRPFRSVWYLLEEATRGSDRAAP